MAARPGLRPPLWLLLLLLGLGLLPGCAAFEHGMQAREVSGRPLSLQTAEGARALAAEADFDAVIARWLRQEGRPDYLFVASRAKLYLFYLEADRAVMFERDLVQSRAMDLGRIPGSLLRKLPNGVSEQLVARRKAAMARAKARQPRPRPRAAAQPTQTPPEAYFGTFDVKAIAERMREQTTAADPGIRSWRRTQLEDGRQRLFAKVGAIRYEVRPDGVTVATPAGTKTRQVTKSLRVGLARVNRALFAHKADAVTQTVLPLATQVAADVSGRTRILRRVEGRTIRIERLPADGLLVYSVRP